MSAFNGGQRKKSGPAHLPPALQQLVQDVCNRGRVVQVHQALADLHKVWRRRGRVGGDEHPQHLRDVTSGGERSTCELR